jgi:hypothetical protein
LIDAAKYRIGSAGVVVGRAVTRMVTWATTKKGTNSAMKQAKTKFQHRLFILQRLLLKDTHFFSEPVEIQVSKTKPLRSSK